MNLLLDTNAYAFLRKGQAELSDLVRKAQIISMSTIVLGELRYGFLYGTKAGQNEKDLLQFIGEPKVKVLDVTSETAEIFGILSATLRRKGRPIPSNDIWIAAHAFQTQSILVSFDAHFQEIENLRFRYLKSD
jgi:tRNA(fMet)-specific endonuclease VapC